MSDILEGSKVWHKSLRVSGVVVEIADDTAYIEQPNGVEASFSVGDLTTVNPREVEKEESNYARDFVTAENFTERHAACLAAIPKLIVDGVGQIWGNLPIPNPRTFHECPPHVRLNFIMAATGMDLDFIERNKDTPPVMMIVAAQHIMRNVRGG
jgi:hypothetical protein